MTQTFIIAEAGVNHNGDPGLALDLVDVAARAGADAVKFQTFRAEDVISAHAPKAEYQNQLTGTDESQLEMVRKLEFEEDVFFDIRKHCEDQGIQFLSTPFDIYSIRFLAGKMEMATLKLPSGEITNWPFLLEAARAGKCIILSTGMSTLEDVERALGVMAYGFLGVKGSPGKDAFQKAMDSAEGQAALQNKVSLLHCTTEYPAPVAEVNLRAMESLKAAFGLPVGLSDHTLGIAVPIAATALGATIIEKHITLDNSLPGPDHKASLEPDELAAMVEGIRAVQAAMGDGEKRPMDSEKKNALIARKSLVARVPIRTGEPFSEENLTAKRPGTGVSPRLYWELLGQPAGRDYVADELIDD